jgi:hypothetical protein
MGEDINGIKKQKRHNRKPEEGNDGLQIQQGIKNYFEYRAIFLFVDV